MLQRQGSLDGNGLSWKGAVDSSREQFHPVGHNLRRPRKDQAMVGQSRSGTAPGAPGLQRRNSRPTLPREDTAELRPGTVSWKERGKKGTAAFKVQLTLNGSRNHCSPGAACTFSVKGSEFPERNKVPVGRHVCGCESVCLLSGDDMVPYPKSTLLWCNCPPIMSSSLCHMVLIFSFESTIRLYIYILASGPLPKLWLYMTWFPPLYFPFGP